MNKLRFYTYLYGYTHKYKRLPVWFLTPIRRVLRTIANKRLKKFFDQTPLDLTKPIEDNLIISLTSFPARINYVYLTVESLLRQTVLPCKIILWLSNDQFKNKGEIPLRLKQLENNLFEIRFVDGDIRSHKKYYYTFKEYPDSKVVLVDDDIIYSDRLIENLLEAKKKNPGAIISRFAFKILRNTDGTLQPYNSWPLILKKGIYNDCFLGTGAGTLIEPSMLYKDALNIDLATKLTPIADDIWINAMIRLSGKSIFISSYDNFLPTLITDNESLYDMNQGENQNDIQLKAINDYYYINTAHVKPF